MSRKRHPPARLTRDPIDGSEFGRAAVDALVQRTHSHDGAQYIVRALILAGFDPVPSAKNGEASP